MADIVSIRRGVLQEAPGDGGSGAPCRAVPTSRPAPDWLELCRVEFCRRYYEQQFGYLLQRVAMPNVRAGDVRPAP